MMGVIVCFQIPVGPQYPRNIGESLLAYVDRNDRRAVTVAGRIIVALLTELRP
jgi:hypothetical protein